MKPTVEPSARTNSREPWAVVADPEAGPICPRCNNATQRNTSMFKELNLVAIRCLRCRHVAIDGDTMFFDLASAATGQLYRRALVYHEHKFPMARALKPREDVVRDVIESDNEDPRWSE